MKRRMLYCRSFVCVEKKTGYEITQRDWGADLFFSEAQDGLKGAASKNVWGGVYCGCTGRAQARSIYKYGGGSILCVSSAGRRVG